MKKTEQETEDVQIKNMGNLVDVLIDEINLLKKGKITPSRANAMSNVTGKIMQAVKLSVETHKYINRLDDKGSGIPLIDMSRNLEKVA